MEVRRILTRTSGYLGPVASHSLQPYRGCTYGRSLCGVGCYVPHNRLITRGRPWGSFLDVRTNAASAYRSEAARERRWARARRERFAVFMSSATDPFVPQERRYGVTRGVLEAMCDDPPDRLILQTHSPSVQRYAGLLAGLARATELRVHISIESDRDGLPNMPPAAATVEARLAAAAALRRSRCFVVITVAPLLPITDPDGFFERIGRVADAVVLDHFIEGDGSTDGARTLRTELPAAMAAVDPASTTLAYRDRMAAVARRRMPGRVGVGAAGFAGMFT